MMNIILTPIHKQINIWHLEKMLVLWGVVGNNPQMILKVTWNSITIIIK